jgi:hypothetical protein
MANRNSGNVWHVKETTIASLMELLETDYEKYDMEIQRQYSYYDLVKSALLALKLMFGYFNITTFLGKKKK